MEPPMLNDHNPEFNQLAPCPCCKGDTTFRGWDDGESPASALRERHHRKEIERPAFWCDHIYRVWDDSADEWVYVAEPYNLPDEAFPDLAFLRSEGWKVLVSARMARHLPGRTVAVLIRRGEFSTEI
ncbi:hypothetical protein AB0M80_13040 [Amycolatopsis sp. NPDC051045]|uniref:hypothetical protein n=1 Tax=Amycolatopsis sp. NPDC051045 TaxID=3156922 RepID=UPI0034207641